MGFAKILFDSFQCNKSNYKLVQSADYLPNSNYVEVFSGIGITLPFHTKDDVVVATGNKFAIVDEIHNGTNIFLDWQYYGNLLIVHSLNNYINNNYSGAIVDFRLAEKMWNGHGIFDKSITNTTYPVYESYKLAAMIFDAKVLHIWNSNLTAMENQLWSLQLPNGGISTAYGPGAVASQLNSTNSETDSMTLIAYNNHLISSIQYPVLLTSSVPSLTIKQKHSGSFNLTVLGNNQNITLSHGSLPVGVQVAFNKSTSVGVTNVVTIVVTGRAALRTGKITFTATGQDKKKSAIMIPLMV